MGWPNTAYIFDFYCASARLVIEIDGAGHDNPVQFNRPDGAGYQFLAGTVLEIGKFNPQIAARMLGALRSWRALEPGRRGLARKALRSIAAFKGLPADVYEIVTKMLDE